MEFRQILTVALFMFAAAVMKSTFSDQLDPAVSAPELSDQNGVPLISGEMLSAIPIDLVAQNNLVATIPAKKEDPKPAETTAVINHIPGSLVAVVVAVLALVSVARRTSNS